MSLDSQKRLVPPHKLYDPLDLEPPVLNARTRLYQLRPMGIGTPLVESLTGYISRLAAAHSVSLGVFVTKELRAHLQERHSSAYRYATVLYDSHTLNRISKRAEDWISLLEELTGCAELPLLTMLVWKEMFSIAGLLRSQAAWCAKCYQQQLLQDGPIYEPLLWMLRPVTVCHVHRETLAEICPHCKRKPRVLSAKSCPGYCSLCARWLGANTGSTAATTSKSALDVECRVAESVGSLLASTAEQIQQSSKQVLKANLQRCLDDLAEGNQNRLHRATALDHKTLETWVRGTSLPSFGNLVRFCCCLEIPIHRFILQRPRRGDSDWEHARAILKTYESPASPEAKQRKESLHSSILRNLLKATEPQSSEEIAHRLGYKNVASFRAHHYRSYVQIANRWRQIRPSPQVPLSLSTREERRTALQKALKENPPPFLYDVATRLRVRIDTLSKQFPDLCKMVVQRNKSVRRAQVEAVLKAALSEDPAPTLRQIRARTDAEIQSWRRWFPDLYAVLVNRSLERAHARREKQKALLRAVLSEDPPPTAKAVALRAGLSQSHLKVLFPELLHAISARYAAHQKQLKAEKQKSFAQQVHRVANDLLRIGQHPSRAKIRRHLPDRTFKGEHLIVREAKIAVEAFLQS